MNPKLDRLDHGLSSYKRRAYADTIQKLMRHLDPQKHCPCTIALVDKRNNIRGWEQISSD